MNVIHIPARQSACLAEAHMNVIQILAHDPNDLNDPNDTNAPNDPNDRSVACLAEAHT